MMDLKKIWEPVAVAIPPADAVREMGLGLNGELRHYGSSFRPGVYDPADWTQVMLKSRDGGMNWTTERVNFPTPGAMVPSPWSDSFITVLCNDPAHWDFEGFVARPLLRTLPGPGLYLIRAMSPDGPFSVKKICDEVDYYLQKQPLALVSRRRWILPFAFTTLSGDDAWGVLRSDDDGEHWDEVRSAAPPLPGIIPPGRGLRWIYCGCEPCVAEYPDGSLHALLRCAHNVHYESVSTDAGESWSPPFPSRFFACATMPGLYRLRNGRLLAVWNNTTPLPEEDHRTQRGGDAGLVEGRGEDFFTNRDVIHAAVSDDGGVTWRGFRELWLNTARNDADFHSDMCGTEGYDKSVHQNQLIERDDGVIVLAFGQNRLCRRIVLFDPDWLLEEDRNEDFLHGLGNVSCQLFMKGVAGGYRGLSGHCSMNRRCGAALVPHPDRDDREVLLIGRHPDTRLLSDREGCVWNFPAARRGELSLRLRPVRGHGGIRIALIDHWLNPSAPDVALYAGFMTGLNGAGCFDCSGGVLTPDVWHDVILVWDLDAKRCEVHSDAGTGTLPLLAPSENGISYLHLQTMADGTDSSGVMFESFSMRRRK